MISHFDKKDLDYLSKKIESIPTNIREEVISGVCRDLGGNKENANILFEQLMNRLIDDQTKIVKSALIKLGKIRKAEMLLTLTLRITEKHNKN